MRKINMCKKLLAALLAASGISALSDGDLLALKTMKDYEKPGKPLSETVPRAPTINFYDVDPKNLLSLGELTELLQKNISEIFYAYKLGIAAQGEVYTKAKDAIGRLNKLVRCFESRTMVPTADELVPQKNEEIKDENDLARRKDAQKQRLMIASKIFMTRITPPDKLTRRIDGDNLIDNILHAYNNKIAWARNKNTPVKLMCVDENDSLENNHNNIGRGAAHRVTGTIFKDPSYIFRDELDWILKGEVNCSGWATVIHWFLNQNGIPAKILTTPKHWEVAVPVINSSKDTVEIISVNVAESGKRLEDYHFLFSPITSLAEDNSLWDGFGIGGSHADLNPRSLYKPLDLYLDTIDMLRGPGVEPWVHGLALEMEKLEKNGKIQTDLAGKSRTYDFRYLPRSVAATIGKRDCFEIRIPLNVERLGKLKTASCDAGNARSARKTTYASKTNPGQEVQWLEADIYIPPDILDSVHQVKLFSNDPLRLNRASVIYKNDNAPLGLIVKFHGSPSNYMQFEGFWVNEQVKQYMKHDDDVAAQEKLEDEKREEELQNRRPRKRRKKI